MNNDVQPGPVRRDPDDVHRSRAPEPVDELLRRSRDLLAVVAAIAGEPGLRATEASRDLPTAEWTLREAEQLVLRTLPMLEQEGRTTPQAQLTAALAQLGATLAAIRDARLAARAAIMTDLQRCLGRLRSATSLADLAGQVPVEINRLGYRRALFSRVSGPRWTACGAFAYGDPQLAHDLVAVGSAVPGRIGRELPETEAVRQRAPVLVEDAQHNPHVHHRLIGLAKTKEYVVAPLIGRGEVVGLLHADQQVETNRVDEFDQRLLGLFAEGLGCAFERIMYFEQLAAFRDQLQEQARSVGDLVDGFPGSDGFLPEHRTEPPRPADPLHRLDGPFAELTRRELDVLRHMVLGESNSQIATELYVSAGTVKTHVKNVLRKLGVANRAEAIARYHAVAQRSR